MPSNMQRASTGSVTSTDGTKIAYQRSGNGPPLLIVAGALGYKEFSPMQQYAKELAKDFTVYNYDRRGRSGSTDTLPYSVDKECDDLAALATEAGGSPCVFGLSSGAALALEAAYRNVPMKKLVLYEPPYLVETARGRPAPDFEANLKQLAAEDRRSEAVSYFMQAVGVPGVAVAIMKLFPFWKGLKSVAHTLPYDAAVMAGFTIPRAKAAALNVPTLVATGEKSPKNLQDTAAELAKIIPNGQFRRLPKQNHGVRPSAIGPLVVEFCHASDVAANAPAHQTPTVALTTPEK